MVSVPTLPNTIVRRPATNQLQAGYLFRRSALQFGVLLILAMVARIAPGQSYLTSTGSPSFNSPEPVELGFVDASNGNLHLSIPLGSYPQRGTSQPQAITLEYDSSIWAPFANGSITEWEANNGPFSGNLLGGWYYSVETSWTTVATDATQDCYTDMSWGDQTGSVHTFHLNFSDGGTVGCPTSADAFATDSSGYHMYVTTGTNADNILVYAPDGTLVHSDRRMDLGTSSDAVLAEDSNGNYISVPWGPGCNDSVYDTLGRVMISGSTCGSDPVVSTSQGTVQYSVSYATINVNTDFQQSGITDNPGTQIRVISSLTLPDAAQSTYTFTYDCDKTTSTACSSPTGQSAYYGELTGITLPTGGTVSYSYLVFKDSYGNMSQWANKRSSAGGSWTYQPSVLTNCSAITVGCQQQTTVTSPSGKTVYTFTLNNGAWPTTIVKEDSSGNALSTLTNTWDFSNSCPLISCQGVSNSASFVTLKNQTTTIPSSSGSLTKQTAYTYDSPQYGNRKEIQEWRYIPGGNSFASVADRTTYISYLYYTGANGSSLYTSNINRPLSVTLCNNSGSSSLCPGGGSLVSQTTYTYDAAVTNIRGGAQHDDQDFGTGYTSRGNATSVSRWVSGSTFLTTSYAYDTTGQVLSMTDPAGNQTTYSYKDSFVTDGSTPSAYTPSNPTNAYPTTIIDPIGSQTASYYWGSGKTAVTADYDTQSTTSHYLDGLDRQTAEIHPIGWSLAAYSSTTSTQSDMYTAVGDSSPSTACVSCLHTQTILDKWGRTSSQVSVNNPIGQVSVDSTYDSDGRLSTQSHPYSGVGDPNHVFETFGYDALDRQVSTTHPDNQSLQAFYGPNITNVQLTSSQLGSTVTYGTGYPQVSVDESGNEVQQWLDGFGRIIEVDEPSSGSSPYFTNYLYDAGDRLTQVVQGGQTRTFAYDGLGRKISENTPEGGSVTYSYLNGSNRVCSGDPSNVCSRTDARNVTSTYTYDSGNRLTGVTYTVPSGQNIAAMPNVCTTSNGTPANVCYSYDQGGAAAYAIGRLTAMTDPTGSETYTYDANGRVTQLSKVINNQTFNLGYTYDAGGDVTQITYPSGRVVQQAYNGVGQLCEVAPAASGCSDNTYYAGGFTYSAPGNLTGFTYGNGVKGTFYYSPDRTQLAYLAYAKGTSTYLNMQYSYQQSSSYAPACPNGTSRNNGSIQCITDNVDSGRTMSYGYDPLKRLNAAKSCGSPAFQQWGLSETFDRFGNRTSQAVTAGSGPSSSLSFSSNNQPNGYTFDPSGNMTVEPLSPPNSMTYDGEDRMTAFSGNGGVASYAYDGNGLRVVKSVQGGTATVTIFSGSSVLAEYDNGAAPDSPSREYVYGGSGLLAMFSGTSTTYYHQDHLSVRLTTDANGNVLSQEGHYPYGEPWYQSGSGNEWFFTSYNRDSESGLDYAMARYYNSRTGTFCSADPLAGSPGDPQSWNRYPYGRNDPIDVTDPSGKSWWSWALFFGGIFATGFAPEIDPFLEDLFGGGDASSAYIPAKTGDLPMDFSNVSLPQLIPGSARAAATIATGAGDGAAGVSSGWTALSAGGALATDKPKTPQEMMSPAMTAAMQALNKKSCADMYGTPQSRANGFTPQNVLNGIVSGTKYGKIAWADKGGGDWGVAQTRPTFPFIPGQASGVVMTINTFQASAGGYWSAGNPAENAETLLHELAHAFNFIRHAGGFAIPNSAETKADPYAFDKKVRKNCF